MIRLTSLTVIRAIPVLFVWLWSTGFLAAKYGLDFIEPFFMLFVRFVIALLIFIGIVVYLRSMLSLRQAGQQILVGVFLHGFYLAGVFFAIQWGVPAGIAAIIVGLQPLLSTVFSQVLWPDRINRGQWMGLFLGLVGVVVVVLSSYHIDHTQLTLIGLLSCFGALFSIAFGTVWQKKVDQGGAFLPSMLFQYIGALIVVGVLTFSFEQQMFVFSMTLVFSMIWLILALSVCALLLLLYMIRVGEIAQVMSYFYLVPPVTVFQAWILFDERLSWITLLGAALSVCGVYLVIRMGHKKTSTEA